MIVIEAPAAPSTVANSWPEETKSIIAKSHDVESGYAHFVDDNTIEVNGHQYQSNQIVIATGQRSHRLAIPGEQFTHTSRDVLSLPHLPQHVTFIGGGYVAMELKRFSLVAINSRQSIDAACLIPRPWSC